MTNEHNQIIQDKINALSARLEMLLARQDDFNREIFSLRSDLNKLTAKQWVKSDEGLVVESPGASEVARPVHQASPTQNRVEPSSAFPQIDTPLGGEPQKIKLNLEKFIGENLISKIGIAITVIGVGIGAKYSIEHDLISPLTRIILGYLAAIVLLGVGIKLKLKYANYSAVLVSGAISIMYFITFAAHSYYGIIPQTMAFALMVVFTVFTVVAALNYNQQVIAHIGLVGAYAVPFLLSDGSGKVSVLFSYMAIINVGILVIALKKYWKKLFYSSFGLTWIIFAVWYVASYKQSEHFGLALTFLLLFFVVFYLTLLASKLIQKQKFATDNIVLLLSNAFIFYGFGFAMLQNHPIGNQLLGLFTLGNAIVHFVVGVVIYQKKLADKNLFYLVVGLVLVFITIAVPVQLDGNWVTLLWAGEAALLFWLGRTKQISIYEKLAYPLMFLALFSIVQDWADVYNQYIPDHPETRMSLFINVYFLSSVLFVAAFAFINILNRNKKYASALPVQGFLSKLINYSIPAIFIGVFYYAFRLEIANYWNQLYADSALAIYPEGEEYPNFFSNSDLKYFKTIWVLNYSLLYMTALAFFNFRKLKNKQFGVVSLVLITITITVFLTQGLYVLSELRENYLEQVLSEYYQRGNFSILIRYSSFGLVALALVAVYKYIRQRFMTMDLKLPFALLLHVTVLWIASSEMIHWLNMAEAAQSYKLGLSILWASYAVLLIVLGIWKKKKYLRIGAIGLFGVTLIKLFFYDIRHLDTIAKTVVLVLLGVLLLIISFLYNKYKHIISDETGVATPNN